MHVVTVEKIKEALEAGGVGFTQNGQGVRLRRALEAEEFLARCHAGSGSDQQSLRWWPLCFGFCRQRANCPQWSAIGGITPPNDAFFRALVYAVGMNRLAAFILRVCGPPLVRSQIFPKRWG
jgi:hypothetical protein